LLKTNETGCVYFVCLLYVVDVHPVKSVDFSDLPVEHISTHLRVCMS